MNAQIAKQLTDNALKEEKKTKDLALEKWKTNTFPKRTHEISKEIYAAAMAGLYMVQLQVEEDDNAMHFMMNHLMNWGFEVKITEGLYGTKILKHYVIRWFEPQQIKL